MFFVLIERRPPGASRTTTLRPYATLFGSRDVDRGVEPRRKLHRQPPRDAQRQRALLLGQPPGRWRSQIIGQFAQAHRKRRRRRLDAGRGDGVTHACPPSQHREIGRAWCRERVGRYVELSEDAVTNKKK